MVVRIVVAPGGRLMLVLEFPTRSGRIIKIDAVTDLQGWLFYRDRAAGHAGNGRNNIMAVENAPASRRDDIITAPPEGISAKHRDVLRQVALFDEGVRPDRLHQVETPDIGIYEEIAVDQAPSVTRDRRIASAIGRYGEASIEF